MQKNWWNQKIYDAVLAICNYVLYTIIIVWCYEVMATTKKSSKISITEKKIQIMEIDFKKKK